jgi:hypothetical protein
MSDKPKITHLYSNIFTNFAILRDSGLFQPDRFTEIQSYLGEDQFEPAVLQNGREIPGWWAHKLTGHLYNEYLMTDGKWSRNKKILEIILTAEEIEKLNKQGNETWSRANDKQKFDRAKKVPAKNWLFPVNAGDEYWETVDEYLDQMEDEGEELPDYIWGVDQIEPTLNLDATDVVDWATDGKGEDLCAADFKGFAEFEKAVEKFVELNKDHKSWYASGKVAVLLK